MTATTYTPSTSSTPGSSGFGAIGAFFRAIHDALAASSMDRARREVAIQAGIIGDERLAAAGWSKADIQRLKRGGFQRSK